MSNKLDVPFGNAICYSGYREGQDPRAEIFPSYEQVKEDLLILARHWQYLRIYDCSPHADLVLQVIANDQLPLKVMLGADVAAEVSNPQCPWGADFEEAVLEDNRRRNSEQIDRMIVLANEHPDSVFAVSVGNEATVEWTDHLVPEETLVSFVERIKAAGVKQPVTFCENYDPWTYKLQRLSTVLDFLSVHTYPAWEFVHIDSALDYTRSNYNSVARSHPDKPVIITEAGWTTASNGRGIEPHNASRELQDAYFQQLTRWSEEEGILTFVFEAFDEPWKGSSHSNEPEKHWGLFDVHRRPKLVMEKLYSDLRQSAESAA